MTRLQMIIELEKNGRFEVRRYSWNGFAGRFEIRWVSQIESLDFENYAYEIIR